MYLTFLFLISQQKFYLSLQTLSLSPTFLSLSSIYQTQYNSFYIKHQSSLISLGEIQLIVFCDNFWTTLSLIFILYYFSLSLFLISLLFLTNKKREKRRLSQKLSVVQILLSIAVTRSNFDMFNISNQALNYFSIIYIENQILNLNQRL